MDRSLGGGLAAAAAVQGFSGALGQELRFRADGSLPCNDLLAVGLGPRDGFELPLTVGLGERVVDASQRWQVRSLGVSLPPLDPTAAERAVPLLVQGLVVGSHSLHREPGRRGGGPVLDEARLLVEHGAVSGLSVSRGELVGRAVCAARDIVDAAAAELTPRALADAFGALGREPSIECRALGPRECEKLGARLLLACCGAATAEPRLIHAIYRPMGRESPRRRYALVGGGITRVARPGTTAELARAAKAGAAAVLGALSALPALGVQAEVHAIVAAGEVDETGSAPRPGDVLSSLAGRAVELLGPANGALLVLGDALAYAARVAPDELISLAAVDGACVRALGRKTAAIVGTDGSLVERYLGAARRVGEELCHLPLPRGRGLLPAGRRADLCPPLPGEGDAVAPWVFLRELCAPRAAWAHVDLAGPALAAGPGSPPEAGLATGFGVGALIDLLAAREGLC